MGRQAPSSKELAEALPESSDRRLSRLFEWRDHRIRAAKFCVVGLSGVAVNSTLLAVLYSMFQLPLPTASPIATAVAICNNYLWNDRWTFHAPQLTLGRGVKFAAVSLGGLLITREALIFLVGQFEIHYLLANLIAITCATGWNFGVNTLWTWRDT